MGPPCKRVENRSMDFPNKVSDFPLRLYQPTQGPGCSECPLVSQRNEKLCPHPVGKYLSKVSKITLEQR